jgi:hypothetical protein
MVRLIRNLLYNNYASGISLYGIDGAQGAKNNLVVNNTIVIANSSSSPGRFAVNISDGSTGNIVRTTSSIRTFQILTVAGASSCPPTVGWGLSATTTW